MKKDGSEPSFSTTAFSKAVTDDYFTSRMPQTSWLHNPSAEIGQYSQRTEG